MSETKTRTWLRALSWRAVALLTTVPFTGWQGAIVLNIIHTVIFYIHERAWLKLQWGKCHDTMGRSTERNHF